jgi:hypothetical protein
MNLYISNTRLLVLFFFAQATLFAQDNQTTFQYNLSKTKLPIKIDGILDDLGWSSVAVAKDFWEKYPRNESFAKTRTEVKITYDDDFIYFAAICFAKQPFIISSLKREITLEDNDGLGIALDPVNTKNNGFLFLINAHGVQGDGLISINDEAPNRDWDGKWYAEVKRSDDRFTIEVAIPFTTLRFEDNKTEWGLNFIRSDMNQGEISTWAKVPLQFEGFDLGYMGKLVWDEAPKRQKRNVALIPYLNGAYNKIENDNGGFDVTRKPNVGLDAKIALNSSLNLDLTTNSDFSQADVDQLVTNLTRFDIFLPERRFFFLENSDIFAGFGIPPLRPFFSRTIGLDAEGLPVPILYGARLSGNITATTRIGLMNVHTLGQKNDPDQNVTVAAFQQNIKGRSYIKGLFLNRQGFNNATAIKRDYGRNAGIENVFISNNGKWQAWAAGHVSYKPNIKKDNYFLDFGALYSGQNFFTLIDYLPYHANYFADQGFIARVENYDAARDTVIRLGYQSIYNESSYSWYPQKDTSWFQEISVGYEWFTALNLDGSLNERAIDIGLSIDFSNLSNFSVGVVHNEVNLPFPISFTDATPLPNRNYRYLNVYTNIGTDRRKSFSLNLNLSGGGFYNGTIKSSTISAIYRARPWGNFELNFQYNDLDFPKPYGNDALTLFGSKIEINFNRYLFWTTFVQYNTQQERFNLNSRLQWRFKPLSDIFLVYTDNYDITNWLPKYRALVFKVNYWLNL